MAFKLPNGPNECLYFTRRDILPTGNAIAWVPKKECPKCKKAKMGKPVDDKKGTIKIRAIEYVCPACGYSEEKKAHEESCPMLIIYTCPHCSKSGETTTEFKKKRFEKADAYIFTCESCHKNIGVTKRLK